MALIDKCLWVHEADYDLHVLAKINLIMHGDGWNNSSRGSSIRLQKGVNNYIFALTQKQATIQAYKIRS